MLIKSNTPLSDIELRRIENIMLQKRSRPLESIRAAFPGIAVNTINGNIYLGAPPWDLCQEIIIREAE